MRYTIMNLADLHWGVLDSNVQTSQYKYILDFLDMYPNQIDMITINGDYFDTRLMLGSPSTIAAINWLSKLIDIATIKGVKRIRMIKGTKEHDNDQLDALKQFEAIHSDKDFFKIFITNTFEETLPGMKALYMPEENMPHEEYIRLYASNILRYPNIAFFHGNFDVVMPEIALKTLDNSTLVYDYAFWNEFIAGPIIGGHWHTGPQHDKLIYVGTPDRWEFGEEEPKGFGMLIFDTETNGYFYRKIENPSSPIYKSYIVKTHLNDYLEDYEELIHIIDSTIQSTKKDGKRIKVRIVVQIDDDKSCNNDFINHLRDYYMNSKTVKITVKNKLQKQRKREEQKRHEELSHKYGFINDDISTAEKIRRYIIEKKGKEYSLEAIEKVLAKYPQEG